ncbi:hypothetical protein M3Y97_01089100 [Aphelenchoides bicaudatus]|nr:hypothetical protein M3Y97_01089100 [Aphelenchoides bicaudatus]
MRLILLVLFLISAVTSFRPRGIGNRDNSGSNAPIVLQFQPDMTSYHERWGESAQMTDISIGTPAQKLQLHIQTINYNNNNGLHVNVQNREKQFQPTASSSFVNTKQYDYLNNTIATDVVKFPNGQSKRLPFLAFTYERIISRELAILYLSRPINNTDSSFILSLLKDFKEKVVVVTYEKNNRNSKNLPSLKLTIGGRPKTGCSNWQYAKEVKQRPEFVKPHEWLVPLDSLKVDGKSVELKNKLASFSLTGYSGISFSYKDENKILSLILEEHAQSDDVVKQLKSKNFSYDIAGHKFNVAVQPKHFYMPKRSREDWFDDIGDDIMPEERDPYHVLPHAALYDKCLLLDFEKKLIAVANRK